MNSDFTSQLYMLMSLSHLSGTIGSNSVNNDNWLDLKTLAPIFIILSPLLIKFFSKLYEYVEDWVYPESNESSVSIKFPVHEIRVQKDGYGKDSSTRQLYSINYLAVNDYIRENLKEINGISNLIEILNVNMDYYSGDTDEKNFVLIPSDSTEILIEQSSQIYCKIKSTEKLSDNQDEKDKNDKKNERSNNGIKTYELVLFCKLSVKTNEEKKSKLVMLNKFIETCVSKYNKKNEEKYE